MAKSYDIAVVGHLCLDIIPHFSNTGIPFSQLMVPGKLIDVGDAVISTGGAASNTGLALHKLGFDVRIVGKVGDDAFGKIIVDIINTYGSGVASDMVIAPGEGTSYSVVINPPGVDRIFLHSAGANNSFCHGDVGDDVMAEARMMHFGYPPLMRRFYENGGKELKTLMSRAKAQGTATSLDMARPDPDGDSGRVDWRKYLESVLPVVDFFLPSIDEIVFMLNPARFDELVREADGGNPAALMTVDEIGGCAEELLGMGAGVVGFKLGDRGFYLRGSDDSERIQSIGVLAGDGGEEWKGAELYMPCRRVNMAGTTGAGDCTIAGFLGAVLKGMEPEGAVSMAVSVGGASVEEMGAVAGVPTWDKVCGRVNAGWPLCEAGEIPAGWRESASGCRIRD